MQGCLNNVTLGVLVLQAVRVAGGRLVQAIYNRITRQLQFIYDQRGQLIDFPTQHLALTDYNLDDDQPTPPMPPQASGENIGYQSPTGEFVNDAMSSDVPKVRGAGGVRRGTGGDFGRGQTPVPRHARTSGQIVSRNNRRKDQERQR